MVINSIAMVFLIAFFIFCFFPTATPVDSETMNWAVVMFCGITMLATVYYVAGANRRYRPPVLIQNRNL